MALPETLADVEFIAQEFMRFAEMPVPDLFRYIREADESFLHNVDGPRGGPRFIGRDAHRRFWHVAQRELKARYPDEYFDFDGDKVAHALRHAFTDVFLRRDNPVDADKIELMITTAMTEVRSEHAVITYHVPCIISSEKLPESFDVGPVRFMPTGVFLARQYDALERYRVRVASQRQPSQTGTPIEDVLVDGAREFYERFPWVATVTVPSSHPKVSERRAATVVDAALDALRLFFPDPFGARLRRGASDAIVTRAAMITSDPDGDLEIATFYNSDDAPAWLTQVVNDYDHYLKDVGEWLVAHVQTGSISDLQRRFLDALHWYGQAIRDDTAAGRIVKLAAVWERLTVAKEHRSGVTGIVANRMALLGQNHGGRGFRATKKLVRDLYSWRSRLMHGSHSPYDQQVQEAAATATSLTRWCVFEALSFFRFLERETLVTDADLEAGYDRWLRNRQPDAG